MFEDTNRLRFDVPLDDVSRQWWIERFAEPFGLTPEDVGDLLSRSWTQEKSMRVTELDGRHERFSITVDGRFGGGDFWFHARTLDLRGGFLNADRMFVSENRQGSGVGRRFMADAAALGQRVGLAKIRLDSEHIGRYAWLRVGFIPDRGSWNRLRVELTHRLAAAIPDIGLDRFQQVLVTINDPKPEAARKLAALRDPVSSRELFEPDGTPRKVPLGRALFLEVQSNWAGEFDLDDPDSLKLMEEYVGETS